MLTLAVWLAGWQVWYGQLVSILNASSKPKGTRNRAQSNTAPGSEQTPVSSALSFVCAAWLLALVGWLVWFGELVAILNASSKPKGATNRVQFNTPAFSKRGQRHLQSWPLVHRPFGKKQQRLHSPRSRHNRNRTIHTN